MKNVSQPLISSENISPIKQKGMSNRSKAMLLALMGSITMGLMNVVAKVLRNYTKVSALQVTFWRSFGMAVGCFILCKV
jgi:hypothetical protein